MKFKDIQKLSDVKFRRLTGVSWATFNLMLAELNKHLPRHIGKGRPHKLPLEDRLLLCIEYWLCTRQISQNPYPIRILPS